MSFLCIKAREFPKSQESYAYTFLVGNHQLLTHKSCKVIFGKNAIAKFKKHAQQMRAIAKQEFGMVLGKKVGSNPTTQQEFQNFVQKVVDSGAARQGSWGGKIGMVQNR